VEVVQEILHPIYEGITEIVTPDRGFDQVAELRRIDPADLGAPPA